MFILLVPGGELVWLLEDWMEKNTMWYPRGAILQTGILDRVKKQEKKSTTNLIILPNTPNHPKVHI